MTKKAENKLRCACGSGKEYKNCHALVSNAPSQETFRKAAEHFAREAALQGVFREKHGRARMPVHASFGGGHIFAVGSELHRVDTDTCNFPAFLNYFGATTIGYDWLDAERAKSQGSRHPLGDWANAMTAHDEDPNQPPTPVGFAPIGAKGTWLRMSYDLFTIRNNATLTKTILKRLRIIDQFQGALYELCVTASIIAAGFTIEFENEKDNTTDHPEFIATDPATGVRFAVEAKSRHRPGIHGQRNGKQWVPGESIGIVRALHDALTLKTKIPYYIFIDVNLPPPSSDTEYQSWLRELQATVEDCDNHGFKTERFPANGIVFTNDPTHYFLKDFVHPVRTALWYYKIGLATPAIPSPHEDIVSRVANAFFQRSNVPETIP